MNNNIDFLFLIEHEDREMAVAQRLKVHLTAQGLTVSILSIEFHSHLFYKITPKNIVFPYAISQNTWPIRYFLDKKYVTSNFISLNWEQLLSSANQEFKKPKGNLLKKYFFHLAWNKNFVSFLTDAGVETENIKVIGNPLHELLHEDIQKKTENLLKLKEEFGTILDNEVIFFPMNYGWAFFDDEKIVAKINQGYDEKIAYEYRYYSKQCLEKYIDFIVQVAATNPNKTFVIRPHPSISERQYRERFERRGLQVPSNILVTKMFTIKEWISISSIIGSSWSTSVWDAIQVGKSGFLFTPFPRPKWLETFWNPIVKNISTPEEFQSLIKIDAHDNKNCEDIICGVSNWLVDISKQGQVFKPLSSSKTSTLVDFLYTLRSRFRFYSMSKFKGVGVREGLRRDFFEPKL